MKPDTCDLVVVGAGPAGACAALSALHTSPSARVLLLDRHEFPRDKACGDGIAPHVLDVLESIGAEQVVRQLRAEHRGIHALELAIGDVHTRGRMARPALVVPRREFDARLVEAAVAAGAHVEQHRVREVAQHPDHVLLDDVIRARVVVAADGPHSRVRAALGLRHRGRMALGLRGYARTPDVRAGRQVIRFGQERQPSYAWAFDIGNGWSNVGYGEVLHDDREPPTRALMRRQLEMLLPGSTTDARDWRGHHLPLSGARWHQPDGRVLFAGDASGLVNPLTGEGIFYAAATGAIGGRVAAQAGPAVTQGRNSPGGRHRRDVRRLLRGNLVSTAAAARWASRRAPLMAGLRAAQRDPQVFDALVELGLGSGRATPRMVTRVARELSTIGRDPSPEKGSHR